MRESTPRPPPPTATTTPVGTYKPAGTDTQIAPCAAVHRETITSSLASTCRRCSVCAAADRLEMTSAQSAAASQRSAIMPPAKRSPCPLAPERERVVDDRSRGKERDRGNEEVHVPRKDDYPDERRELRHGHDLAQQSRLEFNRLEP